MSRESDLAKFVEGVVQDFADEVDPDEVRYKEYTDLEGLRTDLTKTIEGCIADWQVRQREEHKP